MVANENINAARFRKVQNVLAWVLVANVLVSGFKLVVGLLTGTLAMVADGFHSAMDASSNIIGITGARMAARPPDEEHPYGHRRFETMATLAIGGLLLVAAWEILSSAINKLFNAAPIKVTGASFAVMLATMGINVGVVIYETYHGRRLRSDVLLADASQTRVDIFISLSVIIGLVAAALGYPWMDAVIALLIVVLIARAALSILKQTTSILVDAAPVNPKAIERVVVDVPGVESVGRVRSRGPADAIQADIEIGVQPAMTADHADAIVAEIQDRVKSAVDGVTEVQVKITPDRRRPPDRALVARSVADALGLSIHEVTELLTDKGLTLEMHVEVSPALTLAAAHAQASELERRLCEALPEVHEVLTHIEPASKDQGAVMTTVRAIEQREQALRIAAELYPQAQWHNATIRPVLGGYALTLHCMLPGSVSVQEAHAIAEHVETQIRAVLPQVQRVTIHTEPEE